MLKIVRLRTLNNRFWCLECSSHVRLELRRNSEGRLRGEAVGVNKKIKYGYRARLDCKFGEIVSLWLEMLTSEGLKRREDGS